MWSNCKGSAFIYDLFILPFMLLFSYFWEVMGGGISELGKKAYFSLLKFIVLKKLNLSFLNLHLNFSNKIVILSHFLYFSYFYCHSSILFIVSSFFLGHMSHSLWLPCLLVYLSPPVCRVCCGSCCRPLMSNNSFLRCTLHLFLSQCRAARITNNSLPLFLSCHFELGHKNVIL